jgi:hypothetical protein
MSSLLDFFFVKTLLVFQSLGALLGLEPYYVLFARPFLCQNLAGFLIFESLVRLKTLWGPLYWSLAGLFLCQNLADFLIVGSLDGL